jgi:hypothetical protein
MPTPTIPAGNLFMNATLYTGNGTALTVTNGVAGQAFQPDFVWVKSKTQATSNYVYDVIRGAGNRLATNVTLAEAAISGVTAFNSNGFSVGTETGNNNIGDSYVGWQWKAGGAAVANTAGSIASQVSVNANSGFSIVTFTGTGANATVGHGLPETPEFIIVKNRDDGTPNWYCYHKHIDATSPQNYAIYLSLYNARDTATAFWNNTAPTNRLITVGTSSGVNGSTNKMVAYCWTPIAGYSAMGKYTGNGVTDGPFVYLGFRPRWIMIKNTTFAGTTTSNWFIRDTTRDTYNVANKHLWADLAVTESNASYASSVYENLDILSNGFKLRNDNGGTNRSGDTFIYMAFAENPFKYANAR